MLLAFLNDAWNRAPLSANSLRETLFNDQINALQLVKTGSVSSVGKNSTSQSYKDYGPGALTHTQIVEGLSNLLAFYDQIKGKIEAEFVASADFDYTEPADFDYDPTVCDLLRKGLSAASSGVGVILPDIRDMRWPANPPPISPYPAV